MEEVTNNVEEKDYTANNDEIQKEVFVRVEIKDGSDKQ